MPAASRPDLSNRSIAVLLGLLVIISASLPFLIDLPPPDSIYGQLIGFIGSALLLVPLLFLVVKRSGSTSSPPSWFVAHVLSAMAGCILIFAHVFHGQWLSAPGLLLLCLIVLVVQGSLLRTVLSKRFSFLFAQSSTAYGFSPLQAIDKEMLRALIEKKRKLLHKLDVGADESQFSPNLKHWSRKPIQSFAYQRLARRESDMVFARNRANRQLGLARQFHIAVAAVFFCGLLTHIVVVIFFAGYAAGEGDIGWWYLTDWSR